MRPGGLCLGQRSDCRLSTTRVLSVDNVVVCECQLVVFYPEGGRTDGRRRKRKISLSANPIKMEMDAHLC